MTPADAPSSSRMGMVQMKGFTLAVLGLGIGRSVRLVCVWGVGGFGLVLDPPGSKNLKGLKA